METEQAITIKPPLTLRAFAETVLAKSGAQWPPEENSVVREFVEFFEVEGLPTFQRLTSLCQTLGVDVSVRALPRGLRGHNLSYQERRQIFIAEKPLVFGLPEHTLLHELRELIEYQFRELGLPTASGQGLEERAERFAVGVRMSAPLKASQPIVDHIGTFDSGWKQFFAIALLVIFFGAYAWTCLTLPQMEDHLLR